ncbi:MAG: LPS export ABC transporter permease LptG [Legionellaceae bacterium]|nr:LPS export ABC transporter permease LptG [Legionellaceae bacterium]
MRILQKYIGKTVLSAIALVTLMLLGLQVFILFVNQLDDIGKGDFALLPASWYVVMQTPYQVYLFFPMASLLGCLLGLGAMANHRELVVMRAAGVSIAQVTAVVSKVAIILVLGMTLAGETAVPLLARHANDYKMLMISKGQTIRTARGVWLRHQNDFIHIGIVQDNNTLQDVYQYRFNPDHSLRFARFIQTIRYEAHQWQAYQVKQTNFYPDRTSIQSWNTLPWKVAIQPKTLKVSAIEPDEMTLMELHRYIRAQKSSQQNAHRYQLAFWQRVAQPFTTLVMMMLAIPFIFGPLRSSTMGAKFLAGAAVGFGFHIVNRFFGPVSQVFQWSPIFAGIGPTLMFALLGFYLMRRMR